MPRGKKELAKQIILRLREIEVEAGRGKTVLETVNPRSSARRRGPRKRSGSGLTIDMLFRCLTSSSS
jgi:hypothetical protein